MELLGGFSKTYVFSPGTDVVYHFPGIRAGNDTMFDRLNETLVFQEL